VSKKRWLPWLAVAVAGTLAVAGASVGSGSASPDKDIKLGVVTDIGGLNDRGFNSLANKGRLRADKLPGVSTRVVISRSNQDYIPNLASLAQDGYDIVIAVGFLMTEQIGTVAQRFPNVKFAGVDIPHSGMPGKPRNARGLIFRENEAGCLVGDLAARVIKGRGAQVISAVGGIKVPAVDAFIAGYRFCARRVTRNIQVNFTYSNSFTDQAKCKEIALNQIAAGSQVVFAVAGQCGLGSLDAAKERRRWGIGVDADQAFLGPHILTSALKKVDNAVFKTAQAVKAGSFRGGGDTIFSAKSGGVALGKVSSRVNKKLVKQTQAVLKLVSAGKIKPPKTL
jgi:basic membrane protein A and related proteins